MGKRGPPKKPTALRVLHGTDRKGDELEVQPPPPTDADPPDWLGPLGVELWNRMHPMLTSLKLLTAADWLQLAVLCDSYEQLRIAAQELQEEGGTCTSDKGNMYNHPAFTRRAKFAAEVDRIARQFGLTPAARQGMKSGDVSSEADELKFFGP
jgi:P27 family predicted phage terminase small subunit